VVRISSIFFDILADVRDLPECLDAPFPINIPDVLFQRFEREGGFLIGVRLEGHTVHFDKFRDLVKHSGDFPVLHLSASSFCTERSRLILSMLAHLQAIVHDPAASGGGINPFGATAMTARRDAGERSFLQTGQF
jgi:hypothetical protein